MGGGRKTPQKPDKADPMAEMLQTADPAEQIERVQALIVKAQQPPITLVIHFDPMTGHTQVISPTQAPYEALHQVLDAAHAELRAHERQRIAALAQQEAQTQSQEQKPDAPIQQTVAA